FMWRNAVHGKDEALRLIYSFVETLPIATPSDFLRSQIEAGVGALLAASDDRRARRRQVLDWLQVEFEVDSPGQKLSTVETLDESSFIAEVRARRSRTAPRLTPAALKDLKSTYAAHVLPLRTLVDRMATTERQVAAWVNAAYGLTAEDVALMWKTAPPRMPAGVGQ
ncbi:MAG: class I SAM-dependent DNA methyltransferase, partial [Nitrososphaerales archaeon]